MLKNHKKGKNRYNKYFYCHNYLTIIIKNNHRNILSYDSNIIKKERKIMHDL